MNEKRLSGKRAVITGGGRGIGAAVARMLAEEGAAVVVSARSRAQIEAVARELAENGHQALAVPCDVTEPAAIEALSDAAIGHFGGIDILVANAGIGASAPLKALTLAEWQHIFAVNVTGTFLAVQAFLPGMLAAGWGRVVNIASVAGKVGAPYISAYAASKHAVIGFTRSVAAEVATRGVTVNAICPGFVDTPMTDETVARIVEKTGLSAAEARANLERHSPQQRLFTADEVAYQVLCLCDPRAAGITGQALVLDGGAIQS